MCGWEVGGKTLNIVQCHTIEKYCLRAVRSSLRLLPHEWDGCQNLELFIAAVTFLCGKKLQVAAAIALV